MEIILTKQCESLSGALDKRLGYFIQRRGKRFFAVRTSKKTPPPDGHWRFIVACAKLANGLHVDDIKVYPDDLGPALWEAHHFIAAQNIKDKIYNARDILNLKTTFGL